MYSKIWEIQLKKISELLKSESKIIEPIRLRIRLTNKCNLFCKFCIRNTFTKEKFAVKEISKNDLLKLIDEFTSLGGKFVEITGDGEPCMKLELLLNLMSMIKKHGLFGELTTNGTLFTEDSIKKMVEINWDMIRFSIDGKKETHDYLRGKKGIYDKAVKTMQLFRKIKDQKKGDNPKLGVNFVLTNKNYNEIDEIIELLGKIGGEFLWVTPMIVQFSDAKKFVLNGREKQIFVKNLGSLIKSAKEKNIETNLDGFKSVFLKEKKEPEKETNEEIKCFMPWTDIVIAEDGKIGPCFAFYLDGVDIKSGSLKNIWNGESFENLRKSIQENRFCAFCNDCRQWWGPEEANLIKNQLKENDS